MKIIKYTILIVILSILLSCGAMMFVQYSHPNIKSVSINKDIHTGKGLPVFELPSLKLYVDPLNHKNLGTYFFITIIPVWFDFDEYPRGREPPFFLEIRLTPSELGFTFDPRKVSIEVDEIGIIHPYLVSGLWGTSPGSRASNASSEYRMKHLICETWLVNKEGIVDIRQPVSIEATEQWACFKLYFDISIPSPEKLKFATISGIKKNGKEYQIPIVTFSDSEGSSALTSP